MQEDGMAEVLEGKLIISVLAGVRLSQLQEWAPKSTVMRAMPNTPCKVGDDEKNRSWDRIFLNFHFDLFS